MFNIISKTKQYFAVRGYKANLHQQLTGLYGTQKKYTPTQITIAIKKAGLSTKYRKLAYKMYLSSSEIRAFRKQSRKRNKVTQPLASITVH